MTGYILHPEATEIFMEASYQAVFSCLKNLPNIKKHGNTQHTSLTISYVYNYIRNKMMSDELEIPTPPEFDDMTFFQRLLGNPNFNASYYQEMYEAVSARCNVLRIQQNCDNQQDNFPAIEISIYENSGIQITNLAESTVIQLDNTYWDANFQ